ncbi:GTP-binding protein Era [hydrothermal vent metagenome]|uniref:GTP-binding protein Era n=1 Tax=hydrothermal vent metagenome TaxID=652676 RepID=A0A3B0RVX2_9ZZZZ
MTTASGFFAVVGRPNVGKSTLVNALVGVKVAITSSRPQTTRNTIRGVLTLSDPQRQYVFVDTPGLHKPKNSLGERLNKLVYGSLGEADAALFVVDATKKIGPGDRLIADRLKESGVPVVVVVNKTDIAKPDQVIDQLRVAGEWDFHAYVPVSALKEKGTEPIIDELTPLLTDGPLFFPEDMVTDQPDQLWAAELVREKFLRRLREELPHSLAVVVEEIETRPNGVVAVSATVYVERKSQKGIVIGKGGALLRDVGTETRGELERLFGTRVFLDLRVKVEADWQRRDSALDRMGF